MLILFPRKSMQSSNSRIISKKKILTNEYNIITNYKINKKKLQIGSYFVKEKKERNDLSVVRTNRYLDLTKNFIYK